ncbi:hypothetical protein [Vibrio rotiferianus]|uniref:hypothetical protein n=1 Tax=Vibrio rotiferianus TaxID=190895 RepID=UPI0005EF1E7E|nr:hypothetical protein [Vibrio rotiferianus]
MSENVIKFDQLVAQVFENLYSEFPKQIALNPCKLLGYEVSDNVEDHRDEFGGFIDPLTREDSEFFAYTLAWLYESGYLIGTVSGAWNSRVTLSLQGLQLLKSVPKSVESNETLGEQLKSAIKNGSKEHAATLMKEALSTNNIMNLFSSLMNLT